MIRVLSAGLLLLACCAPAEPVSRQPTPAATREPELSFVGGHVFDLLNKLATEAASDDERRRIVSSVLDDAAARGVSVLRIWGSLKRVGSSAEVARSVRLLALVLDENARRAHPLRFIITLMNHQAGYGAPDPTRSLDDQAPGPWHARSLYLDDGWRALGVGALSERIGALAQSPSAASPHIIAWELVNELDTFRHISHGRFDGPEADALRERFIVPAARAIAAAVPQRIMIGDLRGHREAYAAWAPSVIAALPQAVRSRLIWTTHVYSERDQDPESFLRKLDVDLAIARAHGLPFVLGELGQHVPDASPKLCTSELRHDLEPTLAAVKKRGVRALVVWGEGRCRLPISEGRTMVVGAGADSAEIRDVQTLELLRSTRSTW